MIKEKLQSLWSPYRWTTSFKRIHCQTSGLVFPTLPSTQRSHRQEFWKGLLGRIGSFQAILISFVFFLSLGLSPSLLLAAPGYGGVQTSKSGINRSSFSVAYDQLGLAIGDVLVVAVTTDHSKASSVIVQGGSHPGGVTVYNADNTASGQPRLRVDVLVYDGSWPSTLDYRFSVSDSETWIAYATKWSGVDSGNPVAASAGQYEGVTANPVSAALTAPEDGLTAVAVYGAREDDFASNGAPSGYTPIAIGASNISAMGSSSGIAYRAGITSGAVPAAIWTQAAATPAHAVHLLLRGANGGGGTPTASSPRFTPAGGAVTDSVTVTLSSTTSTASIYYTTDNSTPTGSSNFYGGPFTLTRSATVKAIAIADGYNDSAVTGETYTVTAGGGGGGGSNPQYGGVQTSKSGINRSSFSVGYGQLGLAIGDVLVVAVTTDHSNASSVIVQGSGHPGGVTVYNADNTASGQPRLRVDVLVYDGSWPSTLDYRFSVSDSETWIAYATKWSEVDSGNPVAASAGQYEGVTANPVSAALTAPEDGLTAVAVYGAREDDFASNGEPSGYTPIAIGASNISAMGSSSGIAYRAGITSGAVPAAIWTQAAATPAHAVHLLLRGGNGGIPTAAAPTFTPAGGAVTDSVTVTLSSTTSTASIYYTTDNSTPTGSSNFYGGPFTLTRSATVKAIAITDGYNNSSVSSDTYTVTTAGGGGSALNTDNAIFYVNHDIVPAGHKVTDTDITRWFLANQSKAGIANDRLSPDGGAIDIVADPSGDPARGNVMRVFQSEGGYGFTDGLHGPSGGQWRSWPGKHEELYFSYDFYMTPNRLWSRGQKLPGLVGGDWAAGSGGTKGGAPDGTNGFSARLMLFSTKAYPGKGDGALAQYTYYTDTVQKSMWYDDGPGGQVRLEHGKWYTIETYIKLNTPGKSNGKMHAWVDGEMVLNRNNVNWRTVDSLKLDGVFFTFGYGGGNSSWDAPEDQYNYFDNWVLALRPISH